MLEKLKKQVYEANMELTRKDLIIYTWGNVSGIDREKELIVIKPSGVPYDDLTPEKMVVIDLNGEKVEGDLKPSSDTETHLELYRNFENIGGTPILGVNGNIIIGHGISNDIAVKNMILHTKEVIDANLSEKIKEAFQ